MKLSKWAKQEGITYRTAWLWFRNGKLPVKSTQLPSGMIMVEVPEVINDNLIKINNNYGNKIK